MNIIAFLRWENASLVADLHAAGHTVWCDRGNAVKFRKLLNVPVQPIDFGDAVMDLPAPFDYGNGIPGIIDGITDCIELFSSQMSDIGAFQINNAAIFTQFPR